MDYFEIEKFLVKVFLNISFVGLRAFLKTFSNELHEKGVVTTSLLLLWLVGRDLLIDAVVVIVFLHELLNLLRFVEVKKLGLDLKL